MMLDRLEGNEALKEEVGRMLSGRRLGHSLLLIGEQGLGAGFALFFAPVVWSNIRAWYRREQWRRMNRR